MGPNAGVGGRRRLPSTTRGALLEGRFAEESASMSTNKFQALSRSQLSAELDDTERDLLAESMGIQTLVDGETLVSQGDPRRTLFTLASGRVDVCRRKRGGDLETVHTMKLGECAGTRAFIDGSERKASLVARGESEVLTLEPEDFEFLLESHPRVVYKVMRAIFRITHSNLMRMNVETDQLQDYFLRTGDRH